MEERWRGQRQEEQDQADPLGGYDVVGIALADQFHRLAERIGREGRTLLHVEEGLAGVGRHNEVEILADLQFIVPISAQTF